MSILNLIISKLKKVVWSAAYRLFNFAPDSEPLFEPLPESTFYSDQSDSDILRMVNEQFLVNCGFMESLRFRRPQRNGQPIPWFTFSSIDFLDQLDLEGKKFLEIGGGFSTLYWARRGLTGHTLETDAGWCKILNSALKSRKQNEAISIIEITNDQTVPTRNLDDFLPEEWLTNLASVVSQDFPDETLAFFHSKPNLLTELAIHLHDADIVVVDGVARNLCLMLAAKLMPKNGIVILDNSDRFEYSIGRDILVSEGFRAINFTGLGPLNPYSWQTTIFINGLS